MFKVRPKYGSIEAVRAIVKPWINVEGTEWGESMRGLHKAAHTDYGFSDEDCALFAEKLLENLAAAKEWLVDDGYYSEEELAPARVEASRVRNYWLKGGNLGDWSTTIEDAKFVIDQMPNWFFEREDVNGSHSS
jgi:hypothetical protein